MAIEFDDVKEVLERIIVSYGVKSRTELADLLSIPLPTINNWVARGSVPGNYIIQCAIETQANLEWLVTGQLANASRREVDITSFAGKELYEQILASGGKAVLQRILAAYGFSMQKQLGDLLDLSSGTISTWIRRDYFPGDVVVACALDTGASLKWLATGQGEMFPSFARTTFESSSIQIPRYQHVSGRLKENGFWLCDQSLIPIDINNPAYIEGSNGAWLAEITDEQFSNGFWFISVDGSIDICEITRLPGNRLKVKTNSTPFECELGDISPVGKVFLLIQKV